MTPARTATGVPARVARLLAVQGRPVGPALVNAFASGISAATTLAVAWGLGAAAFGRFTVVLSIGLIVVVPMVMGLHFVMYQELPRAEPADRPALVTTALLSTLVLGAALCVAGVLAAPVLTAVFGVDVRTLCFGLALALSLTAAYLTESFLRGLGRYALTAGLKLAVAVAYLGTSAYCLLVPGIGDAYLYLAALIASNVLFAVAATAGFRVVPRLWSAALARTLYRHGAYLTALTALTTVLFGVDVIFLNHWAAQADVGVYSIYNNFPKRLLGVLFTDGVGLVLLPTLATMHKPTALRRIGRLSPAVFAVTALVSFAASAVFFLLLRADYPYSPGLMALSAVGIGVHTVFNLYSLALLMDGVRGARALIVAQVAGTPLVLGCQAALIAWQGLAGGLWAFALSNLVLVALIVAVCRRTYSRAETVDACPAPETSP
ncbi:MULTISPECIES: lipopolysaccharide biosynthesis protein [Nonomuraea]|uniref:lipopolysaccharide biosynthesis protein n=1 Tax=Nonomuraea ceibae TaxID=1935170 RepID=UPI001C5E840E|nr:hypothetical protein [Nonomuraea ceibae]